MHADLLEDNDDEGIEQIQRYIQMLSVRANELKEAAQII